MPWGLAICGEWLRSRLSRLRGKRSGGDAHLQLGRYGENLACRLLEERGYDLLCHNYRHQGRRELDIVCRDEDILCFVEVKTRRQGVDRDILPSEAVDLAKRRHIISASRQYLAEIGNPPVIYRYDVVEVYLDRKGGFQQARHIPAAFSEEAVERAWRQQRRRGGGSWRI